jgi:hypothetical protein
MNKKTIATICYLLAAVFVVIAVIYFVTPADKLPHFFPGYDAASAKSHVKHGIAALFLGSGAIALGWFQAGPKNSPDSTQE